MTHQSTTTGSQRPLRILFLCTGNSARSQMAEAVLNRKGQGRLIAESAGSHPAPGVNGFAVEALREVGIDWEGHQPRGLETVERQAWDIVITVCDRAREACPFFPGSSVVAHWGMEDPAELGGDEETKRRAFWNALQLITRRVELLLSLPFENLERLALEKQVRAIAEEGTAASIDRGSS